MDSKNFLCTTCGSTFRERLETIEEFREAFEVVHQLFGLSETLKIHVILHYYTDYFEMTGKTFRKNKGRAS